MMTKRKSRGATRFKPFLILPLVSLLVLAFANPKPSASPLSQADPAPETGIDKPSVTSESSPKTEKNSPESEEEVLAKMEKELQLLTLKEKDLRQLLESTKNQAKKKELKAHLVKILERKDILKKKQSSKSPS